MQFITNIYCRKHNIPNFLEVVCLIVQQWPRGSSILEYLVSFCIIILSKQSIKSVNYRNNCKAKQVQWSNRYSGPFKKILRDKSWKEKIAIKMISSSQTSIWMVCHSIWFGLYYFKILLCPAALLWPSLDVSFPFFVSYTSLRVLVTYFNPKNKQPGLTLIDFI